MAYFVSLGPSTGTSRSGGWKNRDSLAWFSEYAELVSKNYGHKVKIGWFLMSPQPLRRLVI